MDLPITGLNLGKGDWVSPVKKAAAGPAKRLQICKVGNAGGCWVSWPERYTATGLVAGSWGPSKAHSPADFPSCWSQREGVLRDVRSACLGVRVTGSRAGFRRG